MRIMATNLHRPGKLRQVESLRARLAKDVLRVAGLYSVSAESARTR